MIKKKILHVIHSLEVGGAERLVDNFVREANHDLFKVEVCCLDEIGVLGEKLLNDGFSVTCLKRRPGIDVGLISRLRRLLKKRKVDIIHAHQYTSFFYTALSKGFSDRPKLIFTEHGRFYPDTRKLKRILLDPLLSKTASEIISISEATKEAMVMNDNFPSKRIKVIYNGVKFRNTRIDPALKRAELGVPQKDFLLTTAARLDKIKNHNMLIKMMKKVIDTAPDCRLLIAGDGPEYGRLSAAISDFKLSENVFLLGYRPDVHEIFLGSDVFLLSSFTEGTSVTLLEAMNAALPAIVTNVGGNPEIVHDGITGYLVESDDASAMAEKVLMLYKDREHLKRMGEAGQQKVTQMFSFELMMRKYQELYMNHAV